MSDPETKVPSKRDAQAPAEGEAEGRQRWLSWAVGWVLVPGVIIGLIFGGGLLVGVHFHDSWLARLIVWVVDLF